jgi:hypothetical protein
MRSSEQRHDLGLRILDQHETGLGRSDLGNGGRHRARQIGAVRDRHLRLLLTGRDRVDEIGVEQQWRVLQHPGGDFRLIGGKTEDHRGWRLLAESQRPCELRANKRRRIVELHDECAFGGGAVVRREIGIEIGAGECGGGIAPLGGGCVAHPIEELTNDHDATDTTTGCFLVAGAGILRRLDS